MFEIILIIFCLVILHFVLFKIYENYTDSQSVKKYYFYISKSPKIYCSHNIHNRVVGYISDTDKNFINAISKSYRIKPRKLVKLNPKVPLFDNVDFGIVSVSKPSNIYDVISNFDLFIYGFDTIDIDRIRIFIKDIKVAKKNIKTFWANNNKVENNENLLYIDEIETFITRLKRDPEIEDNKYHCYNDKTNINKQLCNMKYDFNGNLKNTIWDKPCEKNNECPFLEKNKQYQVDRGKCVDGYCELPVGVKRLSYRKYDDSGLVNKPFCHNVDECNSDSDYVFA